ncbi:cytochrome c oxidase subunit 6A, mitochondrial [Cherax quadricarinatus]|nr:cytochrome c oxidase subunit 6A, mitochondrial-like [Cherax quadricarinatus]
MAASLATLSLRSLATSLRTTAAAAAEGHAHHGGTKQWKMVSLLVAFPAICLCMANALVSEHEHRPEFRPYQHLRIRTKRFPWGDGQKSLFHNPHTNALPDGYEDEH